MAMRAPSQHGYIFVEASFIESLVHFRKRLSLLEYWDGNACKGRAQHRSAAPQHSTAAQQRPSIEGAADRSRVTLQHEREHI